MTRATGFDLYLAEHLTSAAIQQLVDGTFKRWEVSLHVVDDVPAPVREWLPVVASALGAEPPRRLPDQGSFPSA